MILEMMTDHKCLSTPLLLALIRPLVGVGPDVFLQVAPGGEELSASLSIAVEGVSVVESHVGVQAIQGGEGVFADIHLAHEWFFSGVDANVNLESTQSQKLKEFSTSFANPTFLMPRLDRNNNREI